MKTLVLAALLAVPVVAQASPVSIGANVGVSTDFADASGTAFSVAPQLAIPVRIAVGKYGAVRITPRADFGFGRDRVSWGRYVDGQEVRVYSDGHKAFLASASLSVGAEGYAPVSEKFQPFIGGSGGLAWIGTYHSFAGQEEASQALLDGDQNKLGDPTNVDPFSSQVALLTDLYGGGRLVLNDKLALFLELGYSFAFVPSTPLRKTPAELNAVRDAYGWNALRGGIGFSYTL